MITQKRLMELLNYDQETGDFTWRNRCGSRRAGAVAGYYAPNGRVVICIDGEDHYAHRLAFLYVNGTRPKRRIYHINRRFEDNWFSNLRLIDSPRKRKAKRKKREKRNKDGLTNLQIVEIQLSTLSEFELAERYPTSIYVIRRIKQEINGLMLTHRKY